jgi:DNA-binding response OmpR family regulator
MALTVDDHTVEMDEDGKEALARFESGKHHLVITDFKLSNMDGLELAEAIKKCSQSTPVIVLTDHADAITTGGGPVSNVDVVLRRPCRLKSFRRRWTSSFPEQRSAHSI